MRIKYHHRQYTAVRTFVSGCEGPSIAVLVRSVLVVWRVKPNNLISIILFLNLSRDQACDRGITFLPRRRACGAERSSGGASRISHSAETARCLKILAHPHA